MNEFEKMDPMSHENLGSLLAYHDNTIHKLYDKINEALKTCDDLIKHIDQIVNENADLEKRLDAIEKHILDEAGCEENTQDFLKNFPPDGQFEIIVKDGIASAKRCINGIPVDETNPPQV